MEQSPSLVTGDPATALHDAIWTSIVATSMQAAHDLIAKRLAKGSRDT